MSSMELRAAALPGNEAFVRQGALGRAVSELQTGAKQTVKGLGKILNALVIVLSQLGESAAWAATESHHLTLWREEPEEIAKGGKLK